jgi:outer membrane protein TolC
MESVSMAGQFYNRKMYSSCIPTRLRQRSSLCVQMGAVSALALLLAGCAVNPEPLDGATIAGFAASNQEQIGAISEPIGKAVTLEEALARAIKFNLDHRVAQLASALAVEQSVLESADMLPSLVANASYYERDRASASKSRSLATDALSPAWSTSSDRNGALGDLTLSWNVLDFGLSYVRAKQSADKALIAEEQRRKAMHRVIEDTRTAYWRAISAERLVNRMRALESDVQRSLKNTRSLARSGLASPLPALTYERELVAIKRELQAMQRELSMARAQLGALINAPPDTTVRLAVPSGRKVPAVSSWRSGDMVAFALNNRPELRETLYELRINEQEAVAALLELLPGIQIYAGANADSNSYLKDADWLSWGTRASWNLMKLITLPQRQAVSDVKEALIRERGLALTMAIMTQVHVSRSKFAHLAREFATAGEYLSVQNRVLKQVRGERAAEVGSEQNVIRERMNAIVAEARYDIAYADLQNGYGNLLSALGADLIEPAEAQTLSVPDLAARIKSVLSGRENLQPKA